MHFVLSRILFLENVFKSVCIIIHIYFKMHFTIMDHFMSIYHIKFDFTKDGYEAFYMSVRVGVRL